MISVMIKHSNYNDGHDGHDGCHPRWIFSDLAKRVLSPTGT